MKAERAAEISTIVFAIAILVFLGALSFQYLGYITHGYYISSNEKPIPIKVIAKQYVWEFIYPNGTVSYDKVVIQAGKPYVFELTSADVIHALLHSSTGTQDASHSWLYLRSICPREPTWGI